MSFDVGALMGTLFQPATPVAVPKVIVTPEPIPAPGDLGAYVREHGAYPPGGMAGWEWKPGERPGPPDPPAADWENGIPWTH